MRSVKYIPHPQNSQDEHYATFAEMVKARPDVIKPMDSMEHNAYHVEVEE